MACSSDKTASESELATRAREGCDASFETLVRVYQAPLLAFLLRRCRDRADAEDLVQDTFVRAYRSLHRFDPRQRFAPWLFTIAHRLALNHHRRLAVPGGEEQLKALACSRPSPAEQVADVETGGRLWDRARRVLGEDRFTMLWLRVVEDLSPGEIARVMGRTGVSVRVELHRARRQLQQQLARDHAGESERHHAQVLCT